MGKITVCRLGKAYKQYPTRWSRLREWLIPSRHKWHTDKWVLKDIDFEVMPGEAVGIIGMNGAGKSTLLKLITGTAQPTVGSVQMRGRVAALLELGMGFHPDFTGRQNVFMAGQLLGMSNDEIALRMNEIEEFAEIGDYIDQPVRVYSSGMQVRLAFSVATAIRPDILIVDEAFSVGDAYFQHKSFERIREFRKQGTTLLIVSHDKQAIQSICDRAMLLSKGQVIAEGKPEVVMDRYNAMLADSEGMYLLQSDMGSGKVRTSSGTGEATVESISIINELGQSVEVIGVAQCVKLKVDVMIHQPIERLVFGFGIKDRLGQVMFGTNTHLTNQVLENIVPGSKITYLIEFEANLGPGSYSVQTALHSAHNHLSENYQWIDLAMIFKVVNLSKHEFVGSSWIPTNIIVSL